MSSRIRATRATPQELEGAEPLLEELASSEHALSRLAECVEEDPTRFGVAAAWGARIDWDADIVLARGQGTTWSIFAPAGADPGAAMSCARRLHALLGAAADDWDLDR